MMTNFVSSVRFKAKDGQLENLMERIKEFPLPKGALDHTAVKTGDQTFCTFITWKEEQDLVNARPEMIAFLDTVRNSLEELSPELGVTDPISGPVIHKSKA